MNKELRTTIVLSTSWIVSGIVAVILRTPEIMIAPVLGTFVYALANIIMD